VSQTQDIEVAWNAYFNEDPKRGGRAVIALMATGRLIPTLTAAIKADPTKRKWSDSTSLLPIIRDAATAAIEEHHHGAG